MSAGGSLPIRTLSQPHASFSMFANHAIPLLSGALWNLDSPASDLSQDRRTPYYPDLDTGTSLLHAWVDNLVRLPDLDTGTSLLYAWFTTYCTPALGRVMSDGFHSNRRMYRLSIVY